MAGYENREAKYNDNLGQIIGRFAMAIVEADSLAKNAHSERILAIIGQPNVDFRAKTSLIGMEQGLETCMNVPPIALTDSRPISIQDAELELDMTVSAHQEEESKLDSKMSGTGSAKVGYGPFSIGLKIQADVSVGKSSKRSSDYRSHTHAKLVMGQGDIPEGLALLLEGVNKTIDDGLKLNRMIMASKLGQLSTEVPDEIPPAPEPEEPAPAE